MTDSECPYCNQPILSDTCYCGVSREEHTLLDNHLFVPMGCDCFRERGGSYEPPEFVDFRGHKVIRGWPERLAEAQLETHVEINGIPHVRGQHYAQFSGHGGRGRTIRCVLETR